MTALLNNAGTLTGVLMVFAFVVNIIVQLTKKFIPLPTKLWCILVSMTVNLCGLYIGTAFEYLTINTGIILLSLIGSFVVAYVAMYGFDTFKDLWNRFKRGENINGDSK